MEPPGVRDPLDSIRQELDDLDRLDLRRRLHETDGPTGPEMQLDGRAVVNFCSNNYLGLANHAALTAAATASMAAEGVGAGAARLIGANLAVHRRLEASIAGWKGTEAALLFSSGYQANVGIVGALAGAGDAVFSDALNHASLIDGARLSRATVHVYPHNDLDALERSLRSASALRRRVIVTEAVFSMEGDTAPIAELVALAGGHGALLVVDEAHAAGVLGPAGVGLAARPGVHVQMGTLGKAFGVAGAYAAGPTDVVELLVNRARSFVFTTAPAVPVVAAAHAALGVVASGEGEALRRQLWRNAAELRAGLAGLGIAALPGAPGHIVPLLIGESRPALALSGALLARGLFVQAIRPPTVPAGTARLRITVTAAHRPEHIARLLAALRDLLPRRSP